MKYLKWKSSFHFIKKNFLLFFLFFLSCGDNLTDLKNQTSIQDIYNELKNKGSLYPTDKVEAAFWHGEFLQACHNDKDFGKFLKKNVSQKDTLFCSNLRNGVLAYFKKDACYYTPESENVKDVYQICLIPGFFIRTVDAYTPMIAKYMTACLVKNKPDWAVETTILPRWGAYIKENNDNTTFETQCNALSKQLEEIISNLRKKYNNPRIHLAFACESFGGKIGLFFLNKFFDKITNEKISIDNFITVHSPLYGMCLAKYMVNNRESMMKLWQNEAFGLLIAAIQYDFINVLNADYYSETFKLLGESEIDGVHTDQALQNLIDRKVKILNFIGTPNDIVVSGMRPSYSAILKILMSIKNHFYFLDASGHEVFKENHWDTFEHTLESISCIIWDLKQEGIFNVLSKNFGEKAKPILEMFQKCQDKTQLQNALKEILAGFDLDEKIFVETNFVEAIELLSDLLKDVTNLFEKEVFNSDVVVTVNEITKDQAIIEIIKQNRDKVLVFDEHSEQVFISSPHIYHACDHAALFEFDQDLRNCVVPYFIKMLS